MDVLGNYYSLKAIVRCASHHFTIAIEDRTHWLYVDDLCTTVMKYPTLQDLLNNHTSGWYFAVYEKYSFPTGVIANVPDNQFSCMQDNLIGHKPTTVNDVEALPNKKRVCASVNINSFITETTAVSYITRTNIANVLRTTK